MPLRQRRYYKWNCDCYKIPHCPGYDTLLEGTLHNQLATVKEKSQSWTILPEAELLHFFSCVQVYASDSCGTPTPHRNGSIVPTKDGHVSNVTPCWSAPKFWILKKSHNRRLWIKNPCHLSWTEDIEEAYVRTSRFWEKQYLIFTTLRQDRKISVEGAHKSSTWQGESRKKKEMQHLWKVK